MPRPFAMLTYVAAAALGWGGYSIFRIPNEANPETASKAHTTKSGDPSTASAQLLERLQKECKALAGTSGMRLTANLEARIDKLRHALPPADDPAAAAIQALEKMKGVDFDSSDFSTEKTLGDRIQVSVRILQWLEADPEAALAHVETMSGTDLINSGGAFGVETWSREAKVEAVLAAAKHAPNQNLATSLASGLGRQVGERKDPAEVKAFYDGLEGDALGNVRADFTKSTMEAWPEDQAAAMIPMAVDGNDPRFLGAILERMSPRESYEWAKSAIEAGDLAQLLTSVQMNGVNLFGNPSGKHPPDEGLTFEQRLTLKTGLHPGGSESEAIKSIAFMDVYDLLNDGSMNGVMASFHEGGTDPRAVLSSISDALPELSASAPDAVRDQVFLTLAQSNTTAALELLANLPEEERYRKVTDLSQQRLGEGDPKHLLELFEAVPFNPEYGTMQERLQAWSRLTGRAYRRYGDDYIEWIRKMPSGVNRDMALSALAGRIEKDDPAQAAALQAEKTEP